MTICLKCNTGVTTHILVLHYFLNEGSYKTPTRKRVRRNLQKLVCKDSTQITTDQRNIKLRAVNMCNRYSAQMNDSRRELKLLTVRVAFPYMWPIAQNKSDATYTLKTPSRTQLPMQTCHYTGGSMSRTDNFRNASCLEVRESTTKRAKSQIKCSSLRQ